MFYYFALQQNLMQQNLYLQKKIQNIEDNMAVNKKRKTSPSQLHVEHFNDRCKQSKLV